MGRPEYWTEAKIIEVSTGYEFISDLAKDHPGAYSAIKKKYRHLKAKLFPVFKKLIWTEDNIFKEALKHKTKTDFKTLANGAYSRAASLGIIDEVCHHMENTRLKEGRLDLQEYVGLSGLYYLYSEGVLVYIGKSNTCMVSRVRWHYKSKKFDRVTLNVIKNLTDIHIAEVYLISKHKPLYNDEFNYKDKTTLVIYDIEKSFVDVIDVSASFGVNYANTKQESK